jgi:hypothetical protein
LTDQRVVYGSDAKPPTGSLALSSADDLNTPLYLSDIQSDHESESANSYPGGASSSDFGEEKLSMNREDSAYEAYLQHTRNLFDERLSAGD